MGMNYILWAFIAVYILQVTAEVCIDLLNMWEARRQGETVPPSFDGFVDATGLSQAKAYTLAGSRLRLAGGLASEATMLLLILTGCMAAMDRSFAQWGLSYYISGVLFFFIPGAALFAVALPFDYYGSFVIEERFGFNRTTHGQWIMDHLKSGLLSVVLFGALLWSILWIISSFPARWWLWGSIIVSLLQLVLVVLYPVLIAPLFNKFKPVEDEHLAASIRKLMKENDIKVKSVLQMDAGTRSLHTNAYFTGLGRTKQIVLYDTLIESHSPEEILAILAHEIGHFKKRHILRQLVLFEASVWAGFYLTYLLLDWPLLYSAFGFDSLKPYVGLFFLGIFWQKAGFFLSPVYMSLSRHHEREADSYAARLLGTPHPLITALKKMAVHNLSNLSPHPLYVRFHYSHPPLVERIALLEEVGSGK